MPQPKVSGFAGVLHLHGRLADDRVELALAETDLVLTSAEFGDAYLRSGWASRYVYDVVRAHTVVLVGYPRRPTGCHLCSIVTYSFGKMRTLASG
jgi:hypothetical protein